MMEMVPCCTPCFVGENVALIVQFAPGCGENSNSNIVTKLRASDGIALGYRPHWKRAGGRGL